MIPEVMRKSFKKCGITSQLDGSEDLLFNAHSNGEEENNFEGFIPSEIVVAQDFTENVNSALDQFLGIKTVFGLLLGTGP